MSKELDSTSLSTMVIIVGLVGLFSNIHNYDRYYLDEPLTIKEVVINDKPEYIYGGKGGTSRYTFAANDYQCRFWLSEGALDAVTKNDSIESEIQEIKIGDTLKIRIRNTDSDFLQDKEKRIRVMGLTKQNKILVDPEYVNQQDNKWRNINLGFSILLLVGGTIWKIRHYYKARKFQSDND